MDLLPGHPLRDMDGVSSLPISCTTQADTPPLCELFCVAGGAGTEDVGAHEALGSLKTRSLALKRTASAQ